MSKNSFNFILAYFFYTCKEKRKVFLAIFYSFVEINKKCLWISTKILYFLMMTKNHWQTEDISHYIKTFKKRQKYSALLTNYDTALLLSPLNVDFPLKAYRKSWDTSSFPPLWISTPHFEKNPSSTPQSYWMQKSNKVINLSSQKNIR